MYNLIIRPLLFCIDPEKVHRMLLSWLKFYRYLFPVRACVRGYSRVSDPFSYGHLQFKNRIGLSAGFDKNAEAFDELADFGFGFLEVSTPIITASLVRKPWRPRPNCWKPCDSRPAMNSGIQKCKGEDINPGLYEDSGKS